MNEWMNEYMRQVYVNEFGIHDSVNLCNDCFQIALIMQSWIGKKIWQKFVPNCFRNLSNLIKIYTKRSKCFYTYGNIIEKHILEVWA
jgi:hypothetical protein